MGKGKKKILGLLAGVGLLASSALAWGPFGAGPRGPMGPWRTYGGQNPPPQQQGYYGPPCWYYGPCWRYRGNPNRPNSYPQYPPYQQPNPQNPQDKK